MTDDIIPPHYRVCIGCYQLDGTRLRSPHMYPVQNGYGHKSICPDCYTLTLEVREQKTNILEKQVRKAIDGLEKLL